MRWPGADKHFTEQLSRRRSYHYNPQTLAKPTPFLTPIARSKPLARIGARACTDLREAGGVCGEGRRASKYLLPAAAEGLVEHVGVLLRLPDADHLAHPPPERWPPAAGGERRSGWRELGCGRAERSSRALLPFFFFPLEREERRRVGLVLVLGCWPLRPFAMGLHGNIWYRFLHLQFLFGTDKVVTKMFKKEMDFLANVLQVIKHKNQ